MPDTFRLNTIEEVRAFVVRLEEWQKQRAEFVLPYINLENVYLFCRNVMPENGGRLFSAILDLRLTFDMLSADIAAAHGSHNIISQNTGNPLEDGKLFYYEMQELHNSINFVVRYRSFFDKFMGILLMMFAEDEVYKSYVGAKSRKSFFLAEARKCPQISTEMVDNIEKVLVEFDNDFRTPEVHNTGRLRKWAFADIDYIDKPFVTLNKYWNFLLPVLTAFDKVFEDEIRARGLTQK